VQQSASTSFNAIQLLDWIEHNPAKFVVICFILGFLNQITVCTSLAHFTQSRPRAQARVCKRAHSAPSGTALAAWRGHLLGLRLRFVAGAASAA
jgi:hypothetical protein